MKFMWQKLNQALTIITIFFYRLDIIRFIRIHKDKVAFLRTVYEMYEPLMAKANVNNGNQIHWNMSYFVVILI